MIRPTHKVARGAMLLLGGVLCAWLQFGCGQPVERGPEKPASEFAPLMGRWVRPDGGYVLEVKGVDPGGVATVSYFNPRPINVGQAVASRDATGIVLTVELRDANYPGSTYRLNHEPTADRLVGTYYQAVEKQTYDVMFDRMQPSPDEGIK